MMTPQEIRERLKEIDAQFGVMHILLNKKVKYMSAEDTHYVIMQMQKILICIGNIFQVAQNAKKPKKGEAQDEQETGTST